MKQCITSYEYTNLSTTSTVEIFEVATSTKNCESSLNYYLEFSIDAIIIFMVAFLIIKIIK